MPINSYVGPRSDSEEELAHLESLIRQDRTDRGFVKAQSKDGAADKPIPGHRIIVRAGFPARSAISTLTADRKFVRK